MGDGGREVEPGLSAPASEMRFVGPGWFQALLFLVLLVSRGVAMWLYIPAALVTWLPYRLLARLVDLPRLSLRRVLDVPRRVVPLGLLPDGPASLGTGSRTAATTGRRSPAEDTTHRRGVTWVPPRTDADSDL